MRVSRWNSTFTVALVAAACSSQNEPTVPRVIKPSLSQNGIELSASGGGIVDLSTAGVGDAQFTFHAMKKADGTVSGEFREHRERNGLAIDFAGVVTCLTVDPVLMRARVGGVITENNSTDPAFLTTNHEVGDDVWFRVQDGGEGNDATDGSTVYGFKPTLVNTSAEYCALPFTGLPWWNPATTFPLRGGNIQVKVK